MRTIIACCVALMATTGLAPAQTADAPLGTKLHPEEGEYIVAGNGFAVYLFKADRQGGAAGEPASACEGDCLGLWPPVLVDGSPAADGKLRAELLGTMTRSDGSTQLTYNGWPLYFYAEDYEPDDIKGHDIESYGEDWYLVGPNGERARN